MPSGHKIVFMNNNTTMPQSSVAKLYVAHSVKQKGVENKIQKDNKVSPTPVPVSQPYQYVSRSYYYDSIGGGYQGL
jgi:hypothetical protein